VLLDLVDVVIEDVLMKGVSVICLGDFVVFTNGVLVVLIKGGLVVLTKGFLVVLTKDPK
jgi:hypothetical protein